MINGEPWFVGKDVASVLGYRLARKALYDHVEDDDKKGVPIQNPLGGKQASTGEGVQALGGKRGAWVGETRKCSRKACGCRK